MTKEKMRKLLIVSMILMCLCIYPLNLIRKESTIYPELEVQYGVSDGTVQELKQTFIAQTSYLSEIAFDIKFLDEKPEEGSLSLTLSKIEDDSEKIIIEKNILLEDINDSAFTHVPVRKFIQKESLYAVKIAGSKEKGTDFAAIYTIDEKDAALGSQILHLDGKEAEGKAVCAYVYGVPLNWRNVLCLWMFIGIVMLTLIEVLTGDIFIKQNKLMEKLESMLNNYQIIILLMELILVFLLVIRIARNEAVDWDESFTWWIVTKKDFFGMLKETAADVHPPLYYMLVMGAMKIFGENIFVAKMVSVAGGIATALLGITLVRKRWGVKTAILFLPVAGLAPQIIFYNLNLRMYSWMTFFVFAAGLFAYEIISTNKKVWWGLFTLVSLGGVYTQYFAVVPLTFIYLFLLVYYIFKDKTQLKRWVVCSIITVVGYLPWLKVVINMMQRDVTKLKESKSAFDLAGLCRWAFECNIELSEYMPAALFLLAVFCFILERKKYKEGEKCFLAFVGGLFFVSYGACLILQSKFGHFWSDRYVVDILLFVWIFLLILISRRNFMIWGMSLIWLGILMLSSYVSMREMELCTIPWTGQAKQLLEQVQLEEKIVYNYDTFDTLYSYYLPNAEFIWYEDVEFDKLGDEFYMLSWGPKDFSWELYANGVLEKESLGTMRLEEGVDGVELRKITYHE